MSADKKINKVRKLIIQNSKKSKETNESKTVIRFGTHLNTAASTYLDTLKYLQSIGANSVQIFVGNNKSYTGKKLSLTEANTVQQYVLEHNIYLIVHAPYLLNFARDPNSDIHKKSVNRLIHDLQNAQLLGSQGVVVHMGKNVDNLSYVQACTNMITGLQEVVDMVEDNGKTRILIENVAGQGSEMGASLQDFSEFWKMIPVAIKSRFRICIDTCHLFAANEYDISKATEVDRFYTDFDKMIGWSYIDCFHLNDSMEKFGSKKDRHQDLSHGFIGAEGLQRVVHYGVKTNKPLIMECPFEKMNRNELITLLKKWCSDVSV